ncbi:MAG: hypothetical protein LBO69_08885 [Ignavibacteria bacterium]|jgi:hypothetical protein|nr:hypothetical protein [Ignavibacteria bacterium]
MQHIRHSLIFFSFFFFISAFALPLKSQPYADVHCIEYPDDKRLHFGALSTDEYWELHFSLRLLDTATPLLMQNFAPTFILTPSDASTDDHLSFDFSVPTVNPANFFPLILNDSTPNAVLRIRFKAPESDEKGRKEARLILGFLDANDPANDTPLQSDTFVLVGKNTLLDIDGYDDFVYFDSIFINQLTPIQQEWRVRNTSKGLLNATSQSFTLLSQPIVGNEFAVEEKNYPLTFYNGNADIYHSWKFYYQPKDTQADSSLLKLLFVASDGVTDTAKVKLYGIGVSHSLHPVAYTNCDVHFGMDDEVGRAVDTIDIGKVRVGNSKRCKITLRNDGNIDYGINSQAIYDEVEDIPLTDKSFTLLTPFCSNNTTLHISDTDTLEIEFTPDRKGAFIARYVINNNFKERGIKSNDKRDYRKTILLSGTGVMPILVLATDTIDFGSVSYANASQTCLSQKDTLISLQNAGNSELIISSITTTDGSFIVNPTELHIPENSQTQILLTFVATPPERDVTGKLLFTDNAGHTDTLTLLAKTLPPIEAKLTLPKLHNKPGTLLEVPVMLTRSTNNAAVADYASSYSFLLRYNRTILNYDNYITLATASEGCYILVSDTTIGELPMLQIQAYREYGTFYPNDTLLILQFRTYLGSADNTEIAVQNAKVGISNVCDDYMKLDVTNGLYSIDSICGLPYKHYNISGIPFGAELTNNYVNSSIEFAFSIPYNANLTLQICNTLGEVLLENHYALQEGQSNRTMDVSKLNSGIYIALISFGFETTPITFIKY